MGFLNFEMERAGCPQLTNPVIDTVQLARQRHPGARVSLDALCKHYGIDNSRRTVHGALLDSEILAEVYLELIGGRQPDFALSAGTGQRSQSDETAEWTASARPNPLAPRITDSEKQAHAEFVAKLGDNAMWSN